MVIGEKNYQIGNRALASVLLLYYHLLHEGGITSDQTVYLDRNDFDGFSFIDTRVNESKMSLDIDEHLIREGAEIYLLCELNDMVGEFEEDFLSHEFTRKIIESLYKREIKAVPEIDDIINLVLAGEKALDYSEYNSKLVFIYRAYVYSRFKSFLS